MRATLFLLAAGYREFGFGFLGVFAHLWGFVCCFVFKVWKSLLQVGCYAFNASSSTVIGYVYALRLHLCSFIFFPFS